MLRSTLHRPQTARVYQIYRETEEEYLLHLLKEETNVTEYITSITNQIRLN